MEDFQKIIDDFKRADHEYTLSVKNLKRAQKRKEKAEKEFFAFREKVDGMKSRLDILEDALDVMRDVQGYTVPDLFNPDFLRKHTSYDDCEEFFTNSGISPDQLVNFKKYPEIVNRAAKEMTDFDNFDDFLKEAILEYNLKNYGIVDIPDFIRDGTDIKTK
ncbi:hypothetical protein LAKU_24c00100 [Apilactobacillus kunkeei EFB6]|uniref:Uncharacterized protein n=1 Tax=Apilactobacillus kunkeei EFB6 TaxID=1419324 RepID=A0A837ADK0_9LACO|nr:hypothetical protein [Apilactobacillus kunkeei]KDB00460.1 hypothetical protein LAKU_24c00100 [Apilactobacillus kunkeei EFB6]KOY76619.1 hypothetical protein RZ54_06440 [Apilactobacillus kunkeei]CAI2556246.1 hypothetical protein AKUH3B203M01_00230 [Apilactobacillus kunkeei]CAI2556492.1 hypothetical protein AKUH3B203M_01240 [Apilactobacillus kunkeei]CAI2801053.1 hypothetical protein AKUH3B203M04_06060 [Apilactobacillus kunkeei]